MATAICRYSKCGKELGPGRKRGFCSAACENAHYRERKAKFRELIRGGMSEAEARKAAGIREKNDHAEKVSTKAQAELDREARARRLAERDAAYAREFPDCVSGEWRGQRRIGMFSGLRKAVEG